MNKLIEKIKTEGRLKRYLDIRRNGQKLFETIVPNKKELGLYKRYESLSKGSIGVLQNEYLTEQDVINHIQRTNPKTEKPCLKSI